MYLEKILKTYECDRYGFILQNPTVLRSIIMYSNAHVLWAINTVIKRTMIKYSYHDIELVIYTHNS